MLGAVVNIVKGLYDTVTVGQRLSETNNEITNLDLFANMDSYERLMAKNNLLLAEYLFKCSREKNKAQLWERVKQLMDENLQSVEAELEKHQATKLDVAKLHVALQTVGGEVDKEIDKKSNDINKMQKELDKKSNDISKMQKEITILSRDMKDYMEVQKKAQIQHTAYLESQKDALIQRISASEVQTTKSVKRCTKYFVTAIVPLYIILMVIALCVGGLI